MYLSQLHIFVVIFSRRQHIQQMCFEPGEICRSSLTTRARSVAIVTLAKTPAYPFVAFFTLGIRRNNTATLFRNHRLCHCGDAGQLIAGPAIPLKPCVPAHMVCPSRAGHDRTCTHCSMKCGADRLLVIDRRRCISNGCAGQWLHVGVLPRLS